MEQNKENTQKQEQEKNWTGPTKLIATSLAKAPRWSELINFFFLVKINKCSEFAFSWNGEESFADLKQWDGFTLTNHFKK